MSITMSYFLDILDLHQGLVMVKVTVWKMVFKYCDIELHNFPFCHPIIIKSSNIFLLDLLFLIKL